jgi:hypothetical protein
MLRMGGGRKICTKQKTTEKCLSFPHVPWQCRISYCRKFSMLLCINLEHATVSGNEC